MSMARRKGISGTNRNKRLDSAGSTSICEPETWNQNGDISEDKKATTMSLAQEKPRYEIPKPFPLTNNNDHSYLHKKFKKMASIMPANETKIDESVTTAKHRISNLVDSINERTNYEAIKTNEDKIGLKERDVQSNINEYTTNYNVNILNQRSVSINRLEKTERIDSDATKDVCAGNGRYVCTYCNLSCAKPSVLEKHIRAHTNERPYPCVPCGFAFKTKSNLYKHSRSRCHKLKTNGIESTNNFNNETELSPESECDNVYYSEELRFPSKIPQESTSPDVFDDRIFHSQSVTSVSCQSNEISKSKSIYKPKFHRAYKVEDEKQKKQFPPNAHFLNEHISKIISENEAIVDVLETPLQKKYGKIKQMAENKNLENIDVRLNDFRAEAPLNLTKSLDSDNNHRKRCYSESFSPLEHQKLSQHPLNPERSIIKDLLLKTLATGLIPVTSENYDGMDPLFVCSLCQTSYRSAENLEMHTAFYCKGKPHFKDNGIKQSPVNFKETKVSRAEHILSRSNSINVTLPEDSITSPLTNFNASQTLERLRPDNLVIVKPPDNLDVLTPLPSPGPLLGHTRLVDERRESRKSSESPRHQNEIELSKNTSSSKRKLEMRSDNHFNPRSYDEVMMRSDLYKPHNKIRCLEPTSIRFNDLNNQSIKANSSLQMFGGEVKILDHSVSNSTLRSEQVRSQNSYAGDGEESANNMRSTQHAGGSTAHNIPKEEPSDLKFSITPHIITPNLSVAALQKNNTSHFPFPPLGVITAYNPLTLPTLGHSMSPNGSTKIFHGGKIIPHVPGIPGPNTQTSTHGQRSKVQPIDVTRIEKGYDLQNVHTLNGHIRPKILENNRLINERYVQKSAQIDSKDKIVHAINKVQIKYAPPTIKIANFDEQLNVNGFNANLKLESLKQEQSKLKIKPKSPRPESNFLAKSSSKQQEFNFENIISKSEITITTSNVSSSIKTEFKVSSLENRPMTSTVSSDRSETSYFQKNISVKLSKEETKAKFLRPSSLPLKPGTFTPKKHHGITPNANTMPLISPETPRPAKAYGQLFLNGNAYTYLGLKCSTKVYYCTINRPQPTYVPNQHSLSMYSNWQICSDSTPHPLKLSTSEAMSLYDSRHRPHNYSIAKMQTDRITTHSSQWRQTQDKHAQKSAAEDQKHAKEGKLLGQLEAVSKGKDLAGGFESNEEYTYVRGRGRGRYVCAECGIRCKKPSMLKKHVRTHTDVRPYTCKHCTFSFKTKGNLTKHMKSKAHYKKCCELGISPTEGAETETGESMQANGDSDEETESDPDDANEAETESSDTDSLKSRLPEHEAAHCLLSLWGSREDNAAPPGLISARPCTYPYVVGIEETLVTTPVGKNNNINRDHPEPMDLSKADQKTSDIKPHKEHSILESLASNTAKLPQQTKEWSKGEPLFNAAYLTEKALQDSKIKQSQLIVGLSKSRIDDLNISHPADKPPGMSCTSSTVSVTYSVSKCLTSPIQESHPTFASKNQLQANVSSAIDTLADVAAYTARLTPVETVKTADINTSTENAKFVASEYLKMARNNGSESIEKLDEENLSKPPEVKSKKSVDIEKEALKNHNEHDSIASKVVVGAGGVAFKVSTKGMEYQSGGYTPGRLMDDGRAVCNVCNKTFSKQSQLRLHINIHYMERPFRCSACAVSFRTKGHLQKHERSGAHLNKVSMTSTFGTASSANPRPFRCSDCNIAFRIHGHLAKHLRSKMHVMKLECSGKLPFGTFAEIERAGVSLTDIDTTDCANSLVSLQLLAQKLHEKDPTKLESWDPSTMVPPLLPEGKESSDEEDNSVECRTECNSDNVVRTFTLNNTTEISNA